MKSPAPRYTPAPSPLDAVLRSAVEEAVRAVVLPILDARLPSVPATSTESSYLTVKQAAERAQVAGATIRRWIKSGRFSGRYAGRHTRVLAADLDESMKKVAAGTSETSIDEHARRMLAKARNR